MLFFWWSPNFTFAHSFIIHFLFSHFLQIKYFLSNLWIRILIFIFEWLAQPTNRENQKNEKKKINIGERQVGKNGARFQFRCLIDSTITIAIAIKLNFKNRLHSILNICNNNNNANGCVFFAGNRTWNETKHKKTNTVWNVKCSRLNSPINAYYNIPILREHIH